jgi:hypothetical protein
MGILNYPDSGSAQGTGAGQLVYTFIPETNAEYVTPLLNDDAVYGLTVTSSDSSRSGGISLEIYTDNSIVPTDTITVFSENTTYFPKPINKIKILNGSYTSGANTVSTMGGRYELNGVSNYSVLQVRKFPKTTPERTSNDYDSLGDIYVHVERHGDWSETGLLQSGGALNNGEDGYGWQSPRKWVGWSYNYNFTGVYRIGRNNEVGVSGPATNAPQHGSTSNVKTFQYKDLTSQTWTNLTPIPDEIQFYNTTDTTNNTNTLTQALIYDTELVTYVMFRKRNAPIVDQTMSNGQIGRFNQLFYRYTKATNVWTLIQAYNVSTWGDPTHTQGPKMFFIASDSSGNSYLFPWQMERTSNTMWRYNLANGDRSQATDSTVAWTEGTFVNNYLFVSPTTGIANVDGSGTDYQVYNPLTNAWSAVSPPSRSASNNVTEPSTWFRGGTVFRYGPTQVGVIGRRTYTTNNTTPANNDRFWGRRFFVYDFSQGVGANWIDKSGDLGNWYPHIMRPSNSTPDNRFVFQPYTSDWDGRFLLMNNGESTFRSRGNYDYVNTKKPKQVTLLGQTGHTRGEMSVGQYSVLAFGTLGSVEVAPRVYQTPGSVDFGGESFNGFNTWGFELVYIDGTVKYGPRHFCPQNVIYNPLRSVYYASGWEFAQSRWVATTSTTRWQRTSYIIDEKTGNFTQIAPDFYDTAADRGWQEIHSAGLAYNDVVHFNRPYDADVWYTTNMIGYNSDGSTYRNRAFTDYTWHPHIPGTNTQRTSQGLTMASDARTNQVVQWGKGPRNIYGIPEGTLFWDGSRLWMYSQKDVQAPFSGSTTARSTTNTVGRQTGFRVIYTTPSVGARTTHTYYGSSHVWRDENFAICLNSTMETYYVFDLNNLYTTEPKIIPSHLPIESSESPASSVANSATIGNNANRWITNKANVGGVEIIYGHTDSTGYRSWYNDNIYIVRDWSGASTLGLDKN